MLFNQTTPYLFCRTTPFDCKVWLSGTGEVKDSDL